MIVPPDFWDANPGEYALKAYIGPSLTPQFVQDTETALGYTLPAEYIRLMQTQNGGCPINTCHPATEPTSWAEDHVTITGFYGVGLPLLGAQDNADDWGYPPIGVYFADCPSAGHDMVALDYRECGPEGEPCVVHVDQEGYYRITWLAPDFGTFIGQLVHESVYAEDPEEEKAEALELVQNAPFSPALQALLDAFPDPTIGAQLRAVAAAIVEDKGFFALHADERSTLMYDVQFLLHTHVRPVLDGGQYLKDVYPNLVALARADEVGTGGYGTGFLEDWWKEAQDTGRVVHTAQGWVFTPEARAAVLKALAGES